MSMDMTSNYARRWAKTQAFIDKYLSTEPIEEGMTFYGMRADSRGTKQFMVAMLIWTIDYREDFLKTRYWKLVDWQVKHDAHWRCSVTGRRGRLEVHHPDYNSIHGFEMFHIDKLVCLCHEEHQKLHAKNS